MKKIILLILIFTSVIYAEKRPELRARVKEKNQKLEIIISKINDTNEEELKKQIIEHKIKKGETLSKIAKKYKISISDIVAENRKIKDINLIYAGDSLIIKR